MFWWEREALYKAWGYAGAPLVSVRVRPVKTKAQEVEGIKRAELETIQAWQDALMRQREARNCLRACKLPVPALCIDYYAKKREKMRQYEEEGRKLEEKSTSVTSRLHPKTPVASWYFQCLLCAELEKERQLEEWVQNTGLFEPLRVARPRKDFMQVYHELREKYVVDVKKK